MKKMLLVFVLFMAGCVEENIDAIPAFMGQDFELKLGEKASLNLDNSSIVVETLQIYDSRCPEDVFCIAAGSYGADLKISDETQSIKVSLCNLDCGGKFVEADTAAFVLNDKSHKIVLVNLLPYPISTNQNEPKKVVLQIIE